MNKVLAAKSLDPVWKRLAGMQTKTCGVFEIRKFKKKVALIFKNCQAEHEGFLKSCPGFEFITLVPAAVL